VFHGAVAEVESLGRDLVAVYLVGSVQPRDGFLVVEALTLHIFSSRVHDVVGSRYADLASAHASCVCVISALDGDFDGGHCVLPAAYENGSCIRRASCYSPQIILVLAKNKGPGAMMLPGLSFGVGHIRLWANVASRIGGVSAMTRLAGWYAKSSAY
jgi:hypothetical protein